MTFSVKHRQLKGKDELLLWQTVCAKFAYMLVNAEHPNDPEVEKEEMAATLMAACLDQEMIAIGLAR